MVKLSVNVNKVATVRNSRGGTVPSVLDAAQAAIDAGAPGITVHPRADARHVTAQDVRDLAAMLVQQPRIELNVEGDPRPDLLDLVRAVRPQQCTLVPVLPGELTSQAGWPPDTPPDRLRSVIDDLHSHGVRVSVFVDPDPRAIDWAASVGGDRIELYTEPFARAFERGDAAAVQSFNLYAAAARHAHACGIGVNAGHDLDLHNLVLFRSLPHLEEVSIGHALISRAIFVGLATTVREYLAVLAAGEPVA